MPCPMGMTAENTSMVPSACTDSVTRSSIWLPPVHSKKVAMPSPRHLPRRADSATRASKPDQSASFRPWSMMDSKAPTS